MENKKESVHGQNWHDEVSDEYWRNELLSLKVRRGEIWDQLHELDEKWERGEISEGEYLEMQEKLLKEWHQTEAQIRALESAMDGKAEVGVADAGETDEGVQVASGHGDGASGIDGMEMVAQEGGAPNFDIAQFVTDAMSHIT